MTSEHTPHSTRGRRAAGVLLAALLAGCASSPSTSPVVARSRLGVVTAADLDRFIVGDPRWRVVGTERSDLAWRRARLDELLALAALTDEARRDRLLESGPAAERWQLRRRAILVGEVERRVLGARPVVDDREVDTYLAAHPEVVWRDERLRLRHIFRRLPARSTEAERARAREEMEAVRSEVLRGADFAQLARGRSDSQTAGFDGLIAPVSLGQLEPAVEDVVWQLEVGEVSPVVETASGLHLFRLEERLPATAVPLEQARTQARARFESEARRAAAERVFSTLLDASAATYDPHLLDSRDGDPAAVVFELGSHRLTVRGVRDLWSALPFQAQRLTPLEEVLRTAAWQELALWEAERQGLATDPAVAATLGRAEEEALVSAASARWVDAYEAGVGDRELADFVAAHEPDFRQPAAWRLRIVLCRLGQDRSPQEVYDQLDELASAVRSGTLELDEAAQLWSDDPSGDDGGDLGWVDAKALAVWAGGRFSSTVRGLAVGELSDPIVVEVYEAERLAYRADALALVRVERSRPEGVPPLPEIREEAIDRFMAARAQEVRLELRRQILERIDASVDDAALAATEPPHR